MQITDVQGSTRNPKSESMARDARPSSGDLESASDRPLGFWMCTAVVIGNTMGMGIFLLPAAPAPLGLITLVGWMVTVVSCLVLARVCVRLARVFPSAAGPLDYVDGTFGPVPALLVVGSYLMSICVTIAVISIGVIGYVTVLLPPALSETPTVVISLLLWLSIVINCFGLRSGGVVQIIGMVLKPMPVGAVMLLGSWVLATNRICCMPTGPGPLFRRPGS